ncbi:hypothetical protein BDZ91DRAFT_760844 [Kalaharituber pfeilii]|nr:hypothetical protein BDZ91DRAFT_760844 [Kalaharituber pfeilii]
MAKAGYDCKKKPATLKLLHSESQATTAKGEGDRSYESGKRNKLGTATIEEKDAARRREEETKRKNLEIEVKRETEKSLSSCKGTGGEAEGGKREKASKEEKKQAYEEEEKAQKKAAEAQEAAERVRLGQIRAEGESWEVVGTKIRKWVIISLYKQAAICEGERWEEERKKHLGDVLNALLALESRNLIAAGLYQVASQDNAYAIY